MPLKVTSSMVPTSAMMASQSEPWPTKVRAIMIALLTTLMVIFSRIVCRHRRPSSTARVSLFRFESINTQSAVSIATAVPPAPIAIPMSAAASAGASLIPSPTIPTPPCSA